MQQSNSPYSIGTPPAPRLSLNVDNQIAKYKEEEQEQKAPPTLAYPLQSLLDFIANTLAVLMQMRTALNTSTNNPDVDKKTVAKIQDKIDKINITALSIVEDLEKLKL